MFLFNVVKKHGFGVDNRTAVNDRNCKVELLDY